jgi:PAS domain S-box-containing protein
VPASDAPFPLLPPEAQALFPPEELLAGLFDVTSEGLLLLQPVFDAARPGQLLDLVIVQHNAAAQRMLRLPEQPTLTLCQALPHAAEAGVLDFYQRAFASTTPQHLRLNYQHDGLDNFYRLTARRVGQGLLVSLTDTADHSRSEVEQALRASQAREQAARADAEAQRNRLHRLLMEAPALITLFQGPEHVFELVNPGYQALVGPRPLLGRPIREAMPELAGQPIFDLLDEVYRSGEPFVATEMLVQLDHANSGELGQNYYNFIYQPTRDAAGAIDGILVFAYEVTVQVRARRLIEEKEQELWVLNAQLAVANEELAAFNQEMAATNEELRLNNDKLHRTQAAMQALNQELEVRVAERTREAEAARTEAERQRARLERFFMQAPAAICVLDGPEHVFELVNPGYQALFPGRALRGRPLAEALPELTQQSIWPVLQQVYATGEPYEGREVLVRAARHPDEPAEDRYFNFVYQARHDAAGAIDGVLVFAHEVSGQVLARRRVEQSEREFRLLSDAIPHLVWTATPAGLVDYFNEQWFAFTGSTPALSYGEAWASYFHPKDLPLLLQHWVAALQTGQPYQVQARLRRADGAYRWVLVRALALRDEQGRITRWFGTDTDIHEQKELAEALQLASRKLATTNKELRTANEQSQASNEELAQANRQLIRTNQALDSFVYTASHDLRQPVYNLAGVFEELKRTATFHDPEAPQLLRMFEAALGQILGTIQGLSEVVQVERRHGRQAPEPVELLPLAQEVIQSMHGQATVAGAAFRLDFAAVPVLRFARLSLQSLLYNLLSNALKYAHPDRPPRVRVASERAPDGSPVLLVQDNGLGLDVDRYGTDLFQMFRRFHDHVGGSGLGLYLVNRIVQQAGGRIEVDSTVGEGTTFRILLPAEAAE